VTSSWWDGSGPDVIGLQLNGRLPVRIEQLTVTRFEMSTASAAAHRRLELRTMSDMSDLKQKARDAKTDVKEAWRGADGESLGDKVANTTDRAKDAVANAGDELHEEADRATRDVAYEQGRADEMSRSR
jgi:hypothetical protein